MPVNLSPGEIERLAGYLGEIATHEQQMREGRRAVAALVRTICERAGVAADQPVQLSTESWEISLLPK